MKFKGEKRGIPTDDRRPTLHPSATFGDPVRPAVRVVVPQNRDQASGWLIPSRERKSMCLAENYCSHIIISDYCVLLLLLWVTCGLWIDREHRRMDGRGTRVDSRDTDQNENDVMLCPQPLLILLKMKMMMILTSYKGEPSAFNFPFIMKNHAIISIFILLSPHHSLHHPFTFDSDKNDHNPLHLIPKCSSPAPSSLLIRLLFSLLYILDCRWGWLQSWSSEMKDRNRKHEVISRNTIGSSYIISNNKLNPVAGEIRILEGENAIYCNFKMMIRLLHEEEEDTLGVRQSIKNVSKNPFASCWLS